MEGEAPPVPQQKKQVPVPEVTTRPANRDGFWARLKARMHKAQETQLPSAPDLSEQTSQPAITTEASAITKTDAALAPEVTPSKPDWLRDLAQKDLKTQPAQEQKPVTGILGEMQANAREIIADEQRADEINAGKTLGEKLAGPYTSPVPPLEPINETPTTIKPQSLGATPGILNDPIPQRA